MMGTLAKRTATRGAWLAAGDLALEGTVALSPTLRAGDVDGLTGAAVNVLQRRPGGFMCESQDTLADDEDLRPLNVRRLLALLRRLALLHGAQFVFEPNGPAFRRSVEQAFGAILGDLFARGAFAGTRPSEAFVVSAGDPAQSARDADAGRLIVELRVAPSLPLRFLTVRLVHDGQRGLNALGS
jgi:phage tail sheath protein FI